SPTEPEADQPPVDADQPEAPDDPGEPGPADAQEPPPSQPPAPDATPLPPDQPPAPNAPPRPGVLPIRGGLRGFFRRERRKPEEKLPPATTTPYVRLEGQLNQVKINAEMQKSAAAQRGAVAAEQTTVTEQTAPAEAEQSQSELEQASEKLAVLTAYDNSSLFRSTSPEDMAKARETLTKAFEAEMLDHLKSIDVAFAKEFLEEYGDTDLANLNDAQILLRGQVRYAVHFLVEEQLKRSDENVKALAGRSRKTAGFSNHFLDNHMVHEAVAAAMRGEPQSQDVSTLPATGKERRVGGRLLPTSLESARMLSTLPAEGLYTEPKKERGKRTAAQLSPRVGLRRNEQQGELDRKTLMNLLQAEAVEIRAELNPIQEISSPEDRATAIVNFLTPHLAKQLEAEGKQSEYDRKKSLRAR
ncbi:MAG TPA: hypothetical protein VMR98_05420, partial [Candidatus Polarisedimenticolaceae bacterium]|nr:hypothetical protein [Candidatus Polarisedimenticolaceae bacterium]